MHAPAGSFSMPVARTASDDSISSNPAVLSASRFIPELLIPKNTKKSRTKIKSS